MMRPGIRTLARQRALQLLFALEHAVTDAGFVETERRFLSLDPEHRRGYGPFARDLAGHTWDHREELDQAIAPALQNWSLDRLPLVDRLVLRMALCEMREFADIPLRVTINESIELVRHFSTDESPQFINAVLDRLGKAYRHKDFEAENPADAEDGEERAPAPPRPRPTQAVRPPQSTPPAPVAEASATPPRPRIRPSGWVLRSDGEAPPRQPRPAQPSPDEPED